MKKIILTLLVTVIALGAVAQNGRPRWTKKLPKAANSTYVYVSQNAIGKTVSEARDNALIEVYRQTLLREGKPVSFEDKDNALIWVEIKDNCKLSVNKVCEYVERDEKGGYVVYVLCQVAKTSETKPNFTDFRKCNK